LSDLSFVKSVKASAKPADFIQSVDLAKSHLIQRVIFWPERWKRFNPPAGITWQWKSVPFEKSSSSSVPKDQHGLYTFVLCPQIASHPKNHFILYIGKADKMTLRDRFRSYFDDMRRIKRPAICYVLNKYVGYLEFCFTPVQQPSEIEQGEESLLSALLPPYNAEFPAEVSQVIRGLH
jgi:hypothetical protein